MTTDQLNSNPILSAFLPSLYVAWSNIAMTPAEEDKILQIVEKCDWLAAEPRALLYRSFKKAPTPSVMKSWLDEIRKVAVPDDPNLDLVAIGIRLAKFNQSDGKMLESAKPTLENIQKILGVVSEESVRFLFGDHDLTQSEKLGTEAGFDSMQMGDLLDGSEKELIEEIKQLLSTDAFTYFKGSETNNYREQVLTWCKLLAKKGYGAKGYPKTSGGMDDMRGYFTTMEILSYHDLSMVIKYGVQFGLFGMSVYFLGTEKHHKKYLKDIGSLDLPGSFAMTETNHGSNVRDIETRATYSHESQSFTIHTPNQQARKDYIGNAALHGQMATVFAKLLIDGKDYGVNAFLVPLRDKNGKTLKGVSIEDCGEKMGLNGVDNGRIKFDNVSIPKENMLDKYASVDKDGKFQSPISSDSRRFFTMLSTLVGGRIGIPRSGLSASKSGLTIAIKYGDQRRQFGPESGKEVPILNYRTHQRRLMPLLANAYASHFALQYLTQRFLDRTDVDIREIEALAAGLKSFCTWNTTNTLQTCREACGGKGYLAENRLGALKNDTEIYTTFEGDNTVLMQLVAKSRLTEFKHEFHEIDLFGMLNYVSDQAKTALLEMNPITVRKTDEEHLLDPEFQLNAFKYRERDILTSAAKRLKKHLDAGMDSFDAFNQCQFHLLNVGHAYTERIVMEQFKSQVERTEDPSLRTILKRLCDLFALSQIEKNKGWYLEHDYMAGAKTKAIRKLINRLCWEVRKDAVPLVDAFRIPESCLAAPIAKNI